MSRPVCCDASNDRIRAEAVLPVLASADPDVDRSLTLRRETRSEDWIPDVGRIRDGINYDRMKATGYRHGSHVT